MKVEYKIDGIKYSVEAPDTQDFKYGEPVVLSTEETDVTFGQSWYEDGYTIESFLNVDEFRNLYSGIENTILNILKENLNIKVEGFTLDKYHKYVTSNEDHFKVVSKTRDLFSDDFNFPIKEMLPKFGSILGFDLTDINPHTKDTAHIIVRINRPNSGDYNPPHKDMYEAYDGSNTNGTSYIPKFLNFWVPISGVTSNSSLPISPKSHLVPENLVLRTNDGGIVGKNKYRVRMVKEWDGNNEFTRVVPKDGEVLIFSSHLIHGLALNNQEDTTRIALEFRLYKKNG